MGRRESSCFWRYGWFSAVTLILLRARSHTHTPAFCLLFHCTLFHIPIVGVCPHWMWRTFFFLPTSLHFSLLCASFSLLSLHTTCLFTALFTSFIYILFLYFSVHYSIYVWDSWMWFSDPSRSIVFSLCRRSIYSP